ncbi:DUF4153 domain-containing protein [Coprobacter tertius]|uniref:DUF4153 domain-containing protein n=1 Tax=Coprobacter tertius TaxID=2944915 RepID=A0ABT1MFW9_9BACT|nr:DUF4153 domain-containing protein [Coprobacter tertius]MCP9611525.1 DUF4153 domain-containing protein [Coprobacter tertius]
MKEKITIFLKQITLTIRNFPAETALSVYCFFLCVLYKEHVWVHNTQFRFVIPLFMILSYLLNDWFKTKYRFIYYLSPLLCVPFFFIFVDDWVTSIAYPITILIGILLVTIHKWKKQNTFFVSDTLHYLLCAFYAVLFTGIAFLLLVSIYYSINYIFDVELFNENEFLSYLSMFIFIIGTPLLFFTFISRRVIYKQAEKRNFGDILLNYIISPAILIYTLILYIYFLTILFSWSLPKGGIAYMVFAFTIIAIISKSLQPFLYKPLYNWYYKNFSFIALPAVTMFWIGVSYRICQYGLTQSRTYLVICGFIMTATLFMFMSRKTGKYLYATILTIILFATFTYIPGISAGNIGIYSQIREVKKAVAELNLKYENGIIILPVDTIHIDSIQTNSYNRLLDASRYIENEKGREFMISYFGVSRAEISRKLLPYVIDGINKSSSIYLSKFKKPYSCKGYSLVYPYETGGMTIYNNDKTLIMKNNDVLILEISYDRLKQEQLKKAGITSLSPSEREIREHNDELMIYRHKNFMIVFSFLKFEIQDDTLSLVSLGIDNIFLK